MRTTPEYVCQALHLRSLAIPLLAHNRKVNAPKLYAFATKAILFWEKHGRALLRVGRAAPTMLSNLREFCETILEFNISVRKSGDREATLCTEFLEWLCACCNIWRKVLF